MTQEQQKEKKMRMTRRDILAKHEMIIVAKPKWLDAELTEKEAEDFEKYCLAMSQFFEEEFSDGKKQISLGTQIQDAESEKVYKPANTFAKEFDR